MIHTIAFPHVKAQETEAGERETLLPAHTLCMMLGTGLPLRVLGAITLRALHGGASGSPNSGGGLGITPVGSDPEPHQSREQLGSRQGE